MVDNKINLKRIDPAPLFSRTFAALMDLVITIFVGIGIFLGFSNIASNMTMVKKYKDDYRKFPASRVNILNFIIRSRDGITAEILKLYVERRIIQIRSGDPGNMNPKQMSEWNALNVKH